MNDHWALQYIGAPYLRRGESGTGFDCWTFFAHVQHKHFGRDIPDLPDELYDCGAQAARDAFLGDDGHRFFHSQWREVAKNSNWADGCAVLMRQLRDPHHVGVWVNCDGGGVIHCTKKLGVIFTTRPSLRRHRWRIEGVYDYAK